MNSSYYRKIIICDILSFSFGIVGVILGILSMVSLNHIWNTDPNIRESDSFKFTISAITFDTSSVISSILALVFGKKMIKDSIGNEENKRVEKYEIRAIRCDMASFIIGIIGLVFGFTSLITLLPIAKNDGISFIATVFSAILDTVSFSSAILALVSFKKSFIK